MNLFLGTYYQLVHVKGISWYIPSNNQVSKKNTSAFNLQKLDISWYFLPKSLTLPPVKFLARFLPFPKKTTSSAVVAWRNATAKRSQRSKVSEVMAPVRNLSPKRKDQFFSTKLWRLTWVNKKTCTWNVFFFNFKSCQKHPQKKKKCSPIVLYIICQKKKLKHNEHLQFSGCQIGHQEVKRSNLRVHPVWRAGMEG